MKLKQCLSLLAILTLLGSTPAYANAVRIDTKKKAASVSARANANDIIFQDFTDVAEGSLPKGFNAGGLSVGTVTTAPYEVAKGVTQNCLEINDMQHSNAYSGPRYDYILDSVLRGLVGVEVRYKYIPTETSQWNSFVFQLKQGDNEIARLGVSSANGSTNLNMVGNGHQIMEMARIAHDTWYTAKWVLDFSENRMDFMLSREDAGVVKVVTDNVFYVDESFTGIDRISNNTQVYGGIWVIDYIRFSKESERMEEFESDTPKGVPAETTEAPAAHALTGRVNVTLDGRLKYTSRATALSTDGEVLVTARSAASILSMVYSKNSNGVTIRKGESRLIFSPDGRTAKLDGKAVQLAAAPVASGNNLLIPLRNVAEAFGYSYSYDAELQCAQITTVNQEGGDNSEEE